MDISPVPMAQVLAGRDGRQYEISGDAATIVSEITLLDDSLHVRFNEGGMYFVVYQTLNQHRLPDRDGDIQETVLRVPMDEWDRRVVDYCRLRAWELRHGKSSNERLDRLAEQRKADRVRLLDEAVGEQAQKMFHSAQKDLGVKPRIFLPRGVGAA